jgi:hypothetical protein
MFDENAWQILDSGVWGGIERFSDFGPEIHFIRCRMLAFFRMTGREKSDKAEKAKLSGQCSLHRQHPWQGNFVPFLSNQMGLMSMTPLQLEPR